MRSFFVRSVKSSAGTEGAKPLTPVQIDPPLQLGEIMAASTMPGFADLPLEFWPGYRRCSAAVESRLKPAAPRALERPIRWCANIFRYRSRGG